MSCNVKIRLLKNNEIIACFGLEIDYDRPDALDPYPVDEETEIILILDELLTVDEDVFFEVDEWEYLEDSA
jgi:hypothetical protein